MIGSPLFKIIRRYDFENGWTLDVHEERDGKTYYQRWAPGVENQSWFSDLRQMPSDWFNEEVAKHPHKVVVP